jgi:hypothetical protein
MDNDRQDAGRRDVPWSFVLDPAANAKVLGDVQRRGLHAARLLADRVVAGLDRLDDATGQPEGAGAEPGRPGDPVTDLVQAWSRVLVRTLEAFGDGDATGPGTEPPAPDRGQDRRYLVDLAGHPAYGPLRLSGGAGSPSAAEVSLRNSGTAPIGPLRPHLADLRSSDGESLPGSVVRFEPATLADVGPQSEARVTVTVHLEDPVPAGSYRSVLLIAGAPEVAVPVDLRVQPAPS